MPADTSGMTAVEAFSVRQREYIEALESRDWGLITEADRNLELARIDVFDAPRRSIFNNVEAMNTRSMAVVGDFFGIGDRREERAAQGNMNSLFERAFFSGDESKIQDAYETLNLLQSIPRDVRQEWDRNNTLNPIAINTNDIKQLLRELIELTRNSEITINVP